MLRNRSPLGILAAAHLDHALGFEMFSFMLSCLLLLLGFFLTVYLALLYSCSAGFHESAVLQMTGTILTMGEGMKMVPRIGTFPRIL